MGDYELYPSPNYGPWLLEEGEAVSVANEVSQLGGNVALYNQAQAERGSLFSGFLLPPTSDIEYQEVVGSGVPTVTGIEFKPKEIVLPDEATQFLEGISVSLGDGDGTVPFRSATQGTLSPPAPYYQQQVCGVQHSQLVNDPVIHTAYEGYLERGEIPKSTLEGSCAASGALVLVYGKRFNGVGSGQVSPAEQYRTQSTTASIATGIEATLMEASEKGLAEVFEYGHEAVAVIDARKPVTLRTEGENLTVVDVPWEDGMKGRARSFGPVSGLVTIAAGSVGEVVVTDNGQVLIPIYEETPESSQTQAAGTTQTNVAAGGTQPSASTDAERGIAAYRPQAPALSALALRPRAFTTRATNKHAHSGTVVSYHDNEAAKTTITIQRQASGVTQERTCVAAPKHPRSMQRHCTMYETVGTISHADKPGVNTIHFSGRVRGRPLSLGTYRLNVTARNSTGQTSQAVTVSFKVIG
jgi:hypothetical protein